MLFNKQTDSRWAADFMGMRGDRISRWGCLLVCLANILGILPGELNIILIKNRGYEFLQNPNCDINKASYIVWNVLIKLFNLIVINPFNKDFYEEKPDTYYIARVIHPLTGSGHYINVLAHKNGQWVCFDVEDGKNKTYLDIEIKGLTKILK